MFISCSEITELDLSNFNTSKAKDMRSMFNGCIKLNSLNLLNFDTSKVSNFNSMFSGCSKLISLNLSNFNTSEAKDMGDMFNGCIKLNSLYLTNFNLLNGNNINNLFFECSNLKFIDLKNSIINISLNTFNNLINKYSTFTICLKNNVNINGTNKYINCKNRDYKIDDFKCLIKSSNNINNDNICEVCGDNYYQIYNDLYNNNSYINCYINPDGYYLDKNEVYPKYKLCYFSCKKCDKKGNETNHFCIECNENYEIELNNSNYFNCVCNKFYYIDEISNKKFCTKDKICPEKYSKLIMERNECIDNCSKDIFYKYEYNNICYEKYIKNTIYSSDINSDITTDGIISNYTIDSSNDLFTNEIEISTIKNDNTYHINNEIKINNITYNTKITYSETDEIFNDKTMLNKYNSEVKIDEVNSNKIYNTYISDKKTDEQEFIYNYNTSYLYTNQSTTNKIELINDTTKNPDKENSNSSISIKTIELSNLNKSINLSNNYNNISEYEIIKNYLLNYYNKTSLLEGNDLEFKIKNILITLSTLENQKNNILENKTTIDLGQCENKLKDIYNISNNETLVLLIYDISIDGMKIPKVEYEIYYQFYSQNLTKLNLTACKNMKVDISIPVIIQDDIDKHNPNSNYYKDVCSKAVSESGTDISLSERKNIFIENNMTLCEEDCNLIDYNYTNKKVKCSCLIKISIPFFNEIKFDKNKLLKSFIDINNFANIKFLKCHKNVFNGKCLLKNYGFHINIFLLIIYFICFFIFYCKYYFHLVNDINMIVDAKYNVIQFKKQNYNKNKTSTSDEINNITKIKIKFKNKNINKKNYIKYNNFFPSIQQREKNNKNIILPNKVDNQNEILIISNISNNSIKIEKEKQITNNSILTSNKNYLKYKEILRYTDNELNSFSYEKALNHDKRTYIQYYLSLLKTQHLLIFSFYYKNRDYNSQIIKIFLFFFFFGLHMMINALFFNDNTMHKIYVDKGSFNFIYQISQIIYSSIISIIITTLIKFLALTEKIILKIKNLKKIKLLKTEVIKAKNILKVKFIVFFICSFLLLIFFLYYISCFCGIYENTQIHLIKDSVISFGLSLIYPFILFLIPGIFRIPALHSKEKDKEYLYKLSKLIQDLL